MEANDDYWRSFFQPPITNKVYLNNAGCSQSPLQVIEEGNKYLQWKSEPWNSSNGEGYDVTVRELYSELIRAESCHCIAFAPSTTFAMTLAAMNILKSGRLAQSCRVLITESEEDSNVFPWQNMCVQAGDHVVLQVVPRPDLSVENGITWSRVIIDQLKATPPVAVLALSCVHWCEGSLFGVEEIATYIRSMPSNLRPYFIIDGTQSIGALPFDVMSLDADFVACSVHKWLLSIYGTSIMYLNPRHHQTWLPLDQHERFRLGSVEAE